MSYTGLGYIIGQWFFTDPITYTLDHTAVFHPCTNTWRQFVVLGSYIIAPAAWWIAHGLLLTSVMLKLALRHEPIKWRASSRKPDDRIHVLLCLSFSTVLKVHEPIAPAVHVVNWNALERWSEQERLCHRPLWSVIELIRPLQRAVVTPNGWECSVRLTW